MKYVQIAMVGIQAVQIEFTDGLDDVSVPTDEHDSS
jgi:hypothetical protein